MLVEVEPPSIRRDAIAPVEKQSNKFGLVRLVLACLVIASHSFELVAGNRTTEPLTRLFGGVSLGELAVDGFFFVSGYLISQSMIRSTSWRLYLASRVLRIVPGFVVAYLLTLLLIGPLTGGDLLALAGPDGVTAAQRLITLQGPELAGALAGAPIPDLDSSMWTIAYEIRSYAIVLLLGLCGVLTRPRLYAAVLLAALAWLVLGNVGIGAKLYVISLCGGAFHVLRHWIPRYTGRRALIAAAAAAAMLFAGRSAEFGLAVFAGYALLWFCLASQPTRLNAIGRRVDISYGLYLYAWPVQNTLVWTFPAIHPLTVFCAATPIAAALGWLSWTLVEKPALTLKRVFEPH